MIIVGSFDDQELSARAIAALKKARIGEISWFSPIPPEHMEEVSHEKKSRVRALVLTGGIIGVLSGLAITIGTSYEWSLVAGGKPIISWPPFIVICFELMILLGGISAVTSFLINARMPAFDTAAGYQPRFGSDHFGVVVRCEEPDRTRVESILRESGAQEVLLEAA